MSQSRSGTQWTDADYAAAGYGRLSLRLDQRTLTRISKLAEKLGVSRAEVIRRMAWGATKKSLESLG